MGALHSATGEGHALGRERCQRRMGHDGGHDGVGEQGRGLGASRGAQARCRRRGPSSGPCVVEDSVADVNVTSSLFNLF